MGNCLSCFKSQANADITSSPNRKKDEMTEVAVAVSVYQQEEPLLHAVKNNVKNIKATSTSQSSSVSEEQSSAEVQTTAKFNTEKLATLTDKNCKPQFYSKLPSIPRTMSSMGSNDFRLSETKINQLFDQYKDSLEDAILAEGIENLCNDLQLNPDDFKVLVLAWKLNASQMCRFTKLEFVQGLKSMKTDSIKSIQQKLHDITCELKRDTENFKDLYRFTFKFGLDVSTGQRILPTDIAILLWRLVFTNNEPPILDRWLLYLEKNIHIRGIPKDTWYMFLNFSEFIGEDLSSYDDTEAWPSLFDDFVEYENDQMNQNVKRDELMGEI